MLWLALRIYLFALWAGIRSILSGRFRDGLKLLIAPVGYWRFLPNAFVLREFERRGGRNRGPLKVMDASSPKLLSLYLARYAEVWATDLDDPKIFDRWKPAAALLARHPYNTQYENACRLSFADESFDLVYSISVIEHIPGRGDTEALAEFRRVLKPGGTLVIEVPYRRQREEIVTRYDSKGAPLAEPRFYERHYDAASVDERLAVDGLRVEQRWILGEWLPIDPWIAQPRLPRLLRIAVLPFEPMLALLNYWARPDDRAGRPLAALLVYCKAGTA